MLWYGIGYNKKVTIGETFVPFFGVSERFFLGIRTHHAWSIKV
jgi:hypothetical protein